MMRSTFKTAAMLLSALTALSVLSACGSDAVQEPGETTAGGTEGAAVTEADTAPAYAYPTLDCGGDTVTLLNTDMTCWSFYSYIDFEEQSGEILDDAMYMRNRGMEERYNFTLEVVDEIIDTTDSLYRTAVYAGDHVYDAAYLRCDKQATFLTEGMLYNLLDYEEFQLDEPWWDYLVNEPSRIGDGKAQYFAANDITLSGLDGTLCVYFNETMMNNLDLEAPYQAVRDGKWTIDMLHRMSKEGANMMSDSSFAWNENGTSIYGMATYTDAVSGFLTGAGESFIKIEDGQPSLVEGDDRFYSLFDKINEYTSEEGTFLFLNDSGNSHYEMVFKNNRALFAIAEIKASTKYRDMNETFGIVPIPKFDEAQTQYYSHRTHVCPTVSVPVTNPDPARTGIILDALAYESWNTILPIYYDIRVSQKGLRNEESIEMLSIIRSTRAFDIGEGYAWTEDLSSKVLDLYNNKRGDQIASTIEKQRTKVEKLIEKTMEYINQ